MSSSSSVAPLLTQEVKDLVDGALDSGNPLLLAVVNHERRPILSFRGSIQTYDDERIGLWVRNVQGQTIDAIKQNPNVALMFRSPNAVLQFHGHARLTTDPVERGRVFDKSPARERDADPERKGIAIIIDIEEVSGVLGFGPSGPNMVRFRRPAATESSGA